MRHDFNGEEREFHFKREFIPYLEFSLTRGLYSVLKDCTEGRWTFNDVAMILSFALHGPSREDTAAIQAARIAARMGFPSRFNVRYTPHPDVVAVLEKEGHGNFASLMADILTETIFGETATVDDSYGNQAEAPADA